VPEIACKGVSGVYFCVLFAHNWAGFDQYNLLACSDKFFSSDGPARTGADNQEVTGFCDGSLIVGKF
jgi:hypothetical protein